MILAKELIETKCIVYKTIKAICFSTYLLAKDAIILHLGHERNVRHFDGMAILHKSLQKS